jgi:hypothetical protein
MCKGHPATLDSMDNLVRSNDKGDISVKGFLSINHDFRIAEKGQSFRLEIAQESYVKVVNIRQPSSVFSLGIIFIIHVIWDILIEKCEPFTTSIPDAMLSTKLQLLTKDEIALFSINGGNAFCFNADDGPLFGKQPESCGYRETAIANRLRQCLV